MATHTCFQMQEHPKWGNSALKKKKNGKSNDLMAPGRIIPLIKGWTMNWRSEPPECMKNSILFIEVNLKKKKKNFLGRWAKELSISNVSSVREGKVFFSPLQVTKNWCFRTVVLEKTLEGPLDCKEIQPVRPKGNQSWIFIGRTDAEAETPIFWPPDVKSWLIGKNSNTGKDWGQEEKGAAEDERVR